MPRPVRDANDPHSDGGGFFDGVDGCGSFRRRHASPTSSRLWTSFRDPRPPKKLPHGLLAAPGGPHGLVGLLASSGLLRRPVLSSFSKSPFFGYFLVPCSTLVINLFQTCSRARIRTVDGHLELAVSDGRNISLRTGPNGAVLFNDQDMGPVFRLVQQVNSHIVPYTKREEEEIVNSFIVTLLFVSISLFPRLSLVWLD